MKTVDTKQKFIKLRAEGYSFDVIGKKLNTSKSTLIEWGKEFNLEIHNLRALEYESTLEQYKLTKKHRLISLSKLLARIDEELSTRDITKLTTPALINLQYKLQDKLEKEFDNDSLSLISEHTDFIDLNLTTRTEYKVD